MQNIFLVNIVKVFFISCCICGLIGAFIEILDSHPFSQFMFWSYTFGGGVILTTLAINNAINIKKTK